MPASMTIGAVLDAKTSRRTTLHVTELIACWQVLAPFMPDNQKRVIAEAMRAPSYVTEPAFDEPIMRLAKVIEAMPSTGQTDGQGDDAIVHLHYFVGGCDWWITEKDAGDPEFPEDKAQRQAFGLAKIHEAELGYIDVHTLCTMKPASPLALVNLDFHWTPKPLRDVWAELGKVR